MEIDIRQIIDIVREAAGLMDRTGGFEVHDKGARENIVTSSDVAVQHFLTQKLGALLPGSGFLCEEEDFADTAHADVWIIDPIDGTANYARGNENCCISVALVRGGELAAGVVYSPWRGELYSAEKGRGAFCNGKPIHVSDRSYERGLLFTAMSTYRKGLARSCSDIIYDIYMECNDVRRTGSAAVAVPHGGGVRGVVLRDAAHAVGLRRGEPDPRGSRRRRLRFHGRFPLAVQAFDVYRGEYH